MAKNLGVKLSDRATAGRHVAEDSFKNYVAGKGYTHYLALQMKTLVPFGELRSKLTDLQNAVIADLGPSVLAKNGDVGDLSVRLIGINQSMTHAIEMAIRSLKPLEIIETPNIEFGMVLGSSEGANLTLFSKTLDDLAEHMTQHLNRSAGVKAERITYGGPTSQPGLFKVPIAVRVGSDADSVSKAKFGKKGRLGKYDFWKLHVVDASDHTDFMEINIKD